MVYNLRFANEMVASISPRSDKKERAPEGEIALFDFGELELGAKLGSGSFCDVYVVKRLNDKYSEQQQKCHQNDKIPRHLSSGQKRSRDLLMKLQHSSDFAVKFIQQKWNHDAQGFHDAASDMATERDILATLHHPHIVKIRGWAMNGSNAFHYYGPKQHEGYFLIMDRVEETLEDRLNKWKLRSKHFDNLMMNNLMDPTGRKKQEFLVERLRAAHDLASALEYVHEQNVIYRDLKPANCGFDSRNDIKLFDFGLSRDLPVHEVDACCIDEVFQMSGRVGTIRYMANEVAKRRPYNQKADVYSFGHLLWEMMALEKPYATMRASQHRLCVIEQGMRPELKPSWPKEVCDLLSRAWDPNMCRRPSMREIRSNLKEIITSLDQSQ